MQTDINKFRLFCFEEVLSSNLKKFFSQYSYVGDERRSPKYCVRIGAFLSGFFCMFLFAPRKYVGQGASFSSCPALCLFSRWGLIFEGWLANGGGGGGGTDLWHHLRWHRHWQPLTARSQSDRGVICTKTLTTAILPPPSLPSCLKYTLNLY